MKNLTDFRKTVETGVDPPLGRNERAYFLTVFLPLVLLNKDAVVQ